jgi:hypothetical protein
MSLGDRYLMYKNVDSDGSYLFQSFEYFSINKDNKIYTIDEDLVYDDCSEKTVENADNTSKYNDVVWESPG